LIVFGRLPLGTVTRKSGFRQFHPVLELHTNKIAFATGERGMRGNTIGRIGPFLAAPFQRKSGPRRLHKNRMAEIVIGFDTVHFVKTTPLPLT